MADKQTKQSREAIGDLRVKVDVDISEALTGLKALQREARKATQALRELESRSVEVIELGDREALAKMKGFQVFPVLSGPATVYIVKERMVDGGDSE